MKPGLELMAFQREAVRWMARKDTAMLVGDPGVGKTPIACAAAQNFSRILVVCPPIATGVWEKHFRDWTHIRDIQIAETRAMHQPDAFVKGWGVRIVGYSRAQPDTPLIDACKNTRWSVLILDEVHALKTPEAQRTKAIYGRGCSRDGGVAKVADKVWCLSGTPLLNHSAEFWTHLRALYPEGIQAQGRSMTYDQFIQRYANTVSTPYGQRVTGSKRTDELATRVKPFIRRIRLKDVIKDMPELRIVETPLPKIELPQPPNTNIGDGKWLGDDELLNALEIGATHLATHRRELGEAKAPYVAEFIAGQLEDAPDDKIIVFAHHRNVIQLLTTDLRIYRPLVIDGSTPQPKRENFIQAFQEDPRFRLIVLAIDAASEAITLTAARHVVFAESSWTPARNAQAIARAYRRGQKNAVLVRFMTLPDTLDERIMQVLADKARAIARIIDKGKTPASEPEPQLFP